jgi:hypothetical protein
MDLVSLSYPLLRNLLFMPASITKKIEHELRKRFIENPKVERLPSERDLENILGASRTALRKALRFLESEGLLFSYPGGRIRWIKGRQPQIVPEVVKRSLGDNFSIHELPSSFVQFNSNETVVIRILTNDFCKGAPDKVKEWWYKWREVFIQDNPSIDIELVSWPNHRNAFDKILRNVDIVMCPANDSSTLLKQGSIQNLNSYIAADNPTLQDEFLPGPWRDCQHNGSQLAMPFGVVKNLMMIPKSWLAELSHSRQLSWEQFLKCAKKFSFKRENSFHLSSGIDLLQSLGLTPWAIKDELVDYPQKLDLLKKILTQANLMKHLHPYENPSFNSAFSMSSTGLAALQAKRPDEFIAFPFPIAKKGHPLRLTMGLFLTSHSKHSLLGWEVIRDLASSARQESMGHWGHYYPALKDLTQFSNAPSNLSQQCLLDTMNQDLTVPMSLNQMVQLEHQVVAPELIKLKSGMISGATFLRRVRIGIGTGGWRADACL